MTRRSRAVVAGSTAAALLLSGCSVLQIRTTERDSGPIRVGVEKEAGQDPSGEPTGPVVPEGMELKTRSLGEECPVDLSFAIGNEWIDNGTTPQFVILTRGALVTEGDSIVIQCNEAYNDSAQAAVESKRQYEFSKQGSTVLAERTGTFGSGYYWTFQGLLGEGEIFAINQQPTAMYGARIAYQVNGRLVEISVDMRTLETEEESVDDYKQMLPTLEIDGQPVPMPTFK